MENGKGEMTVWSTNVMQVIQWWAEIQHLFAVQTGSGKEVSQSVLQVKIPIFRFQVYPNAILQLKPTF